MHNYFLVKAAKLMQIQISMLENFISEIKIRDDSHAIVLLNERLANDMYDLKKQIQVACDHVIYGISRVQIIEINTKLDECRGVIQGLENKIKEAQKLLSNFIKDIDLVNPERAIIFTKDFREFKFNNAINYFEDWVIPNTYFHSIIAYAILRKSGFNIGKANFLSAKFVLDSSYENLEELPFGGKIYNAIGDASCLS